VGCPITRPCVPCVSLLQWRRSPTFIWASESTVPCSAVRSTNNLCPVRVVCSSRSVALRHGFLQAHLTHEREHRLTRSQSRV
jgi:hypothetical protein